MFDNASSSVTRMVTRVRCLEVAGDDAGRVEQIRELEELKRAASAAQVRIAAELVASQRAEQVAAGVPSRRAHRGVGEQVALARGESPHRGSAFVGMATALVHEMPCTMAALSDGRITEWAATCLVRETAVLQVHDRAEVDARLESMLHQAGTSEGKLVRAAKGHGAEARPAVGGGAGRQGGVRPVRDDPAGAGHDGLRQRAATGHRGRGHLRRPAPGGGPRRRDR